MTNGILPPPSSHCTGALHPMCPHGSYRLQDTDIHLMIRLMRVPLETGRALERKNTVLWRNITKTPG